MGSPWWARWVNDHGTALMGPMATRPWRHIAAHFKAISMHLLWNKWALWVMSCGVCKVQDPYDCKSAGKYNTNKLTLEWIGHVIAELWRPQCARPFLLAHGHPSLGPGQLVLCLNAKWLWYCIYAGQDNPTTIIWNTIEPFLLSYGVCKVWNGMTDGWTNGQFHSPGSTRKGGD